MTDTVARRVGYGLTQGLSELDPLPIIARRAPATSDLRFPIGQVWINQPLDDAYLLTSVANNSAHWEVISANTPGSAPTTKFVVDSDGTGGFLTVQAGIDAANADGGGVVYVRPGVYTENLTLYTNIVIQGAGLETTIAGVHTPPAVGIVSFFDCSLTSATDIVTSAAAGISRIIFFNCQINCTNGYIADVPNWTGRVDLFSCETASTADGVVRIGAALVVIKDSSVGAGATALSITGGTLVIMSSRISCPISPAGACAASITQGCYIGGGITTAGTTALLVANSTISSGAVAALTQSSAGVVTLSDVMITTAANPAIAGAGAGTVTLANVTFTSARNLVGTLTLAHVDEVRLDKLVCGDSTYRTSPFTSDNNIIGAYGITTGGVVGTSYRGIQSDLQQNIGNGTASPQGIRGSLTCLTGTNAAEGYGLYGIATQNDGSVIASNLIGALGYVHVAETGFADEPQQWTAGVQSILSCTDGAGIFAAGIQAAGLFHLTYNTPFNGRANGLVVSRSGGGAGTAGAAAFKVIAGGAIADWNYGLDLVTIGAGAASLYGLGDIRLANGTVIDSLNATDSYVILPANGRVSFQLGDATGAEAFEWYSSTPAIVASMNSYGQLDLNNCTAGVSGTRETRFSADSNLIQSYGTDATAAGASALNGLMGNLSVTSGNGGHTPNGVHGEVTAAAGSNILMPIGSYGLCTQIDGSIIASTAAGVEGHLNILEANTADQPQFFAFGVKGYLDSTDGAGATPATCRMAGVGSIVEYNTPFNGTVYGVNVSRLDAGTGAGTAGLAAYGVTQGIRGAGAIADWNYGLDLYNGGAGVAYAISDIRLWNQALITSSASGVLFTAIGGDNWTFQLGDAIGANKVSFTNTATTERAAISSRGDITGRNINVTNLNIPAFYASPIVQSAVNTGAAPSGVAGDINLIHLQDGSIMEEFVIVAQAILAPRMTATGLEIGGDQILANGYEYNWGVDANRRFSFVSQTSAAFFMEATFIVDTVANVEHFFVGFRKNAANNGTYTNYTDAALIGLHPATAATVAIVGQVLNGGAWAYTNSTDAWANGATIKVRVNVSSAGVVSYLINGAAPTAAPAAFTFDAGDILVPCIHFTQAAAAFTPIKLTQLAVGYQN